MFEERREGVEEDSVSVCVCMNECVLMCVCVCAFSTSELFQRFCKRKKVPMRRKEQLLEWLVVCYTNISLYTRTKQLLHLQEFVLISPLSLGQSQ